MNLDTELLFRVLFTILWIIFIVNITWVRFSSREQRSKYTMFRPEQRLHILALAFFAPFWFGGIILYILLPNWIAFLSIPLPDWFRFIMAAITATSIPFIIWGYRTLGKNWVHALEPTQFLQKKHDELVTSGPYRHVRNPIYLGCFVFIIALALVAANWLLLLPVLFITPIIYAQIPNEERMLIDRFGDEYREYMKRTPRIIPKL